LGKLGDKEAVMPLIEVLCNQDEDVQVQLAAVKSLGRLGENWVAHVASVETGRLQDKSRLCRKGAYALGELGDRRAISVLTAQLKSEDRHMRRIAAHALGKLGDKEAVMPLIEVLCNQDEDVQVQLAAVKSLGRLGDNRADRILAHLAGQESSRLQEEASIALKRLSSLLYAVYTVK